MSTKLQVAKEFIKNNPLLSNNEINKRTNVSLRTISTAKAELRRLVTQVKFEKLEEIKEQTIEEKIEERRDKAKIKLLADQNKRLIDDYDKLMEKYDHALLIKEKSPIKPIEITINKSINSQAVPIIQFSDWHIEERIERQSTQGFNEYNPDIATKRVHKLVENTLKLIKKERQDTRIDEIAICLGGDFINSFLHDHDVQMNFMSPIEATVFVKQLLVEALTTIAKYGHFKKISVICIRGNHSRLTKKMSSSTDYKMNLEAVLYYMLKQELGDSLFEWYIPESEMGYITIFGKVIRAFHGQQVSYQGGIGDISVPLNKLLMKWDATIKADYNLMHHYHRLMCPTQNTSLNGSLCGWNSYALSRGFKYELPAQSFQLLDAKKGFTVRTPIFCE